MHVLPSQCDQKYCPCEGHERTSLFKCPTDGTADNLVQHVLIKTYTMTTPVESNEELAASLSDYQYRARSSLSTLFNVYLFYHEPRMSSYQDDQKITTSSIETLSLKVQQRCAKKWRDVYQKQRLEHYGKSSSVIRRRFSDRIVIIAITGPRRFFSFIVDGCWKIKQQ